GGGAPVEARSGGEPENRGSVVTEGPAWYPCVYAERALSVADPALSPWGGAAGRSGRAHDRGGAAPDDVADGTRGLGARRALAAGLQAQRDTQPLVPAGRAARRRITSLRELNPDFRDLLLAFAAQGVEFVVVGAYA